MRDLPRQETLTCEFKSDRKCLPDKELIEAVVCMANSQGGEIYLGVEDGGSVTGLHANHRDFASLVAMIANRTPPAEFRRPSRTHYPTGCHRAVPLGTGPGV